MVDQWEIIEFQDPAMTIRAPRPAPTDRGGLVEASVPVPIHRKGPQGEAIRRVIQIGHLGLGALERIDSIGGETQRLTRTPLLAFMNPGGLEREAVGNVQI